MSRIKNMKNWLHCLASDQLKLTHLDSMKVCTKKMVDFFVGLLLYSVTFFSY